MNPQARQPGVDLARWLAFVGMVLVNFGVVMRGDGVDGTPWMGAFVDSLSGRAASLFVVLAGIGLGWTAGRTSRAVIVKRGLFLFAIGLLNATIFSGDILHFYGVWFLLAAVVMRWPVPALLSSAAAIVSLSALLIVTLDYDAGWDWQALEYTDFWTLPGMLRHLVFNGWHPVLPWFAFLLLGLALSRVDLGRAKSRYLLLGIGAAVAGLAQWLSGELVAELSVQWGDPETARALFGTASIPPMPLYVLAAGGSACAALGLCLLLAEWAPGVVALLAPAGRQTLTLYVAHILIGMGCLEALDMIGNQTADCTVVASVIFCFAATALAWLWSRRFAKGPLEAVMRKCTG